MTPFQFASYNSEMLDSGNSVLDDLSSLTGLGDLPTFPNGKQVIFFSLGLVFVVGAVAMMSRTLIADNAPAIISAIKSAIV